MGGIGELGRSLGNQELVDVVNVSTGTIEKFMLVARSVAVTLSGLPDVDPSTGDYPQSVIPNNSISFTGFSPFGIAQERIAPADRGSVLTPFGASIVRVGSQTFAAGSRGGPLTTAGTVAGTTGDLAVFFCTMTASETLVIFGQTYTFTVSHAYGFLDVSRCGY